MFARNGTALSQEDRAEIARRRGLCFTCGASTHEIKIMGRRPLTNENVYIGVCIKCHPDSVPPEILRDWQARVGPATSTQRFKGAVMAVNIAQQHPRAGPGPIPSTGSSNSVNRGGSKEEVRITSKRRASPNTTDPLSMQLMVLDSSNSSNESVVEACKRITTLVGGKPIHDPHNLSRAFSSVLSRCAKYSDQVGPYNASILFETSATLLTIMKYFEGSNSIRDTDIDIIIGILNTVLDSDVDNVVLLGLVMDIVVVLCSLRKDMPTKLNVIAVTIDCMIEHEKNKDIQEKGCAILASLAAVESLQVNLSIGESGGIDAIISAFAKFTNDLKVQFNACRALCHLSTDPESRMLISAQGGIILLTTALNNFPDHTDLLDAAASALLNLSSDAQGQALANSTIAETARATLRRHPKSPSLQQKCRGILDNLDVRAGSENAKGKTSSILDKWGCSMFNPNS